MRHTCLGFFNNGNFSSTSTKLNFPLRIDARQLGYVCIIRSSRFSEIGRAINSSAANFFILRFKATASSIIIEFISSRY